MPIDWVTVVRAIEPKKRAKSLKSLARSCERERLRQKLEANEEEHKGRTASKVGCFSVGLAKKRL